MLINFWNKFIRPTLNLIINKFHGLVDIFDLLNIFRQFKYFAVKFRYLWSINWFLLVIAFILHLEILQFLPPLLILFPKLVNLSLVVTDSH